MAEMAILQEVDKCMRCNGCVIGCKRTWQMKAETIGSHKVAYDQRMAVKSQRRVDVGPFVSYRCWHCSDPPCAKRCPFDAITKEADGAVNIDRALCNPAACDKQCVTDCQRGGYPKVGVSAGSDAYLNPKAEKCTLCHDKIDSLPSRTAGIANEPTCVFTCPAKAMTYDTKANILAKMDVLRAEATADGKTPYWNGDSNMFWFSTKGVIAAPKADPFIEDHVAPIGSALLSGPFAKAALVPTLIVGGLMALSARKTKLAGEVR